MGTPALPAKKALLKKLLHLCTPKRRRKIKFLKG
jgi:hypothetical protein